MLRWLNGFGHLLLYIILQIGVGKTSGLSNWTIPTTTTPDEKSGMEVASSSYSFDTKGFAYFPLACAQTKKCPIHVALHGCRQGLKRTFLYFFYY